MPGERELPQPMPPPKRPFQTRKARLWAALFMLSQMIYVRPLPQQSRGWSIAAPKAGHLRGQVSVGAVPFL